jgi:hypothetical protein
VKYSTASIENAIYGKSPKYGTTKAGTKGIYRMSWLSRTGPPDEFTRKKRNRLTSARRASAKI